jgi:hypothetical protein
MCDKSIRSLPKNWDQIDSLGYAEDPNIHPDIARSVAKQLGSLSFEVRFRSTQALAAESGLRPLGSTTAMLEAFMKRGYAVVFPEDQIGSDTTQDTVAISLNEQTDQLVITTDSQPKEQH